MIQKMKIYSLVLVSAPIFFVSTAHFAGDDDRTTFVGTSAPETHEYIKFDALKRLQAEISAAAHASYDEDGSGWRGLEHISTPDETPLLLPKILNISGPVSVLSLPRGGYYPETLRFLQTSDEIVIPFLSLVHDNNISAIAYEVSNSTLNKGATFIYTTGNTEVTNNTFRTSERKELRITSFSTKCTSARVLDSRSGKLLTQFYFTHIRSPSHDVIIRSPISPGNNAGFHCNGSTGKLFDDHGKGSQRFWDGNLGNFTSGEGEIRQSDLSDGNEVLLLPKSVQASAGRIIDAGRGSGDSEAVVRRIRNLVDKYEDETRQYNSLSFLVLSIAAVLSAAAAAICSPNKSRRERGLFVINMLVILAFLFVWGFAYFKYLSRPHIIRLNAVVEHYSKYLVAGQKSELIVEVDAERRFALVAENLSSPKLLISTFAITCLALAVGAVYVCGRVYMSLRKSKKRMLTEETK